jgi:lipoic acid synthetase
MTIGQYLQPTKMHLNVKEFVHPEQFEIYREVGMKKGFKIVESGPMVRSSYHAEKHV